MPKSPVRAKDARGSALAELELKLANAVADERLRTARDIQAGVLQRLAAMRIHTSRAVDAADTGAVPSLVDIARGIDSAMKELSDTISSAEPAWIAGAGLGGALAAGTSGATLVVQLDDRLQRRHPMRAELATYYACREATQNAFKHAGVGATVSIRLTDVQRGIEFIVTDDGVGFDATIAQRGVGLFNIRERIESAGGRVAISSAPGLGATVSGFVPDELIQPVREVALPFERGGRAADREVVHARLRRELVLETDTERRRIMRDLHDGAQQRLVALRVKIGLATERAAPNSSELALLTRLAGELDAAIAELRDLARGLLLASENTAVGPALRNVTRHWPMDVQVRERRLKRSDAAVEEAVYRCCLEALQRARATEVVPAKRQARATVSIFERDRAVHFVVRGSGSFDAASAGARQSLSSMVDRAAVVGGSLTVSDLGGQGHVVRGSIPIAGAS